MNEDLNKEIYEVQQEANLGNYKKVGDKVSFIEKMSARTTDTSILVRGIVSLVLAGSPIGVICAIYNFISIYAYKKSKKIRGKAKAGLVLTIISILLLLYVLMMSSIVYKAYKEGMGAI